ATERLVLRHRDGVAIEVRRGRLTRIWEPPGPRERASRIPGMPIRPRPVEAVPPDPGPPEDGPLPLDLADELRVVDAWLERHAADLRVEHVDGVWAAHIDPLPSFHPPTSRSDEPRSR